MRTSKLAALFAAAALAGCGSDSPTEPSPSAGSITPQLYLQNALDFEQDVFLYADKIDWTSMRADVTSKVPNPQRYSDTYPAIRYSIEKYFRPFGDNHSGFWEPSAAPGRVDTPSNNALYRTQGTMLGNVAYLYVPPFSGLNPTGHADSALAVIKTLDANKPCGWIIDVRNNFGGTWASMFAGLNPLVGNGQFAGLVDGSNNKAYFYVQNGEAGVYDPSSGRNIPQQRASSTYTLSTSSPPVALLQGPLTASAGEIILLSFKGLSQPVRTFGADSYGDTSVPAGTYLKPDSAFLNVTAALMFDRTGKVYGGVVTPDQPIPLAPTDSVVRSPGVRDVQTTAALSWLATQSACGGTATTVAPKARLDESVFPQQTGPRTRPLNVSPYFFPTTRRATN